VKALFFVALLLSGCAHLQCDGKGVIKRTDRKIAMTSYIGGWAIGVGGCLAGFAGAGPIAIPICLGGFGIGLSGIVYLGLDDSRCRKVSERP
jgi:hypothetical protein